LCFFSSLHYTLITGPIRLTIHSLTHIKHPASAITTIKGLVLLLLIVIISPSSGVLHTTTTATTTTTTTTMPFWKKAPAAANDPQDPPPLRSKPSRLLAKLKRGNKTVEDLLPAPEPVYHGRPTWADVSVEARAAEVTTALYLRQREEFAAQRRREQEAEEKEKRRRGMVFPQPQPPPRNPQSALHKCNP
jgi:hypothetical protein